MQHNKQANSGMKNEIKSKYFSELKLKENDLWYEMEIVDPKKSK